MNKDAINTIIIVIGVLIAITGIVMAIVRRDMIWLWVLTLGVALVKYGRKGLELNEKSVGAEPENNPDRREEDDENSMWY